MMIHLKLNTQNKSDNFNKTSEFVKTLFPILNSYYLLCEVFQNTLSENKEQDGHNTESGRNFLL